MRIGEVAEVGLCTLLMLSTERFGYHAMYWSVPLLQNQLRQNIKKYSSDTGRRSLHRLGYAWKWPRYILALDSEREKKRRIAAPCQVCADAASYWLKD